MRLSVVAVGGLKLPGAKAMQAEYLKRLKRYGGAEVKEVSASKRRELERRVAEEGEALKKAIPKGALVIVLDRTGKRLDSPGLAAWMDRKAGEGRSHLAFLVGGSDGVPDDLVAEADLKLTFSALTFPHQLFRLMLLEQLYRARTIHRGEPYHK